MLKKEINEKSANKPISKRELPLSQVSGFQTFPGRKKTACIFFLHKVKKQNRETRVSEWRQTIPGKKIRPLVLPNFF